MTHAQTVARADVEGKDKPYGDVEYADSGYQEDGVKRYPLDTEKHVRAAWSYINQADNAERYEPEDLKRIRSRIRKAGEEYGIQFAPDDEDDETETNVDDDKAMRSQPGERGDVMRFARTFALDDIYIQRGGSGREVHAYAAVFGIPTEIRDEHGHYREVIHRGAFNRTLSHGIDRIGCFYNHGYTMAGTPSDLGSVPIGSPVEVKADQKGLFTVTRFNKSPLADSVLEAIRAGDIKGYSFRGRVVQSDPPRVPRRPRSGDLPTITRVELGLSEYGPTPVPFYRGAGIVAVRSMAEVADYIKHAYDEDLRAELARSIAPATPEVDPADANATPDDESGPGAEDPAAQPLLPAEVARTRAAEIRRHIRAELIRKGMV